MSATPAERAALEEHPIADGPLPAVVDWILGAIVALGGVLSIVAGAALTFGVDRALLAEGVEDGTITVTAGTAELADPEAVEVARAIVSWTGVGLLVTGLGMVLFAVWYVLVRRRVHSRAGGDDRGSAYTQFAVLGAATTAMLSVFPFSPALGGALAGYLEHGESDRTVSVGALAGFLPVLPVLVLLAFVLVGLVAGLLAVEQPGAALAVGASMVFVAMFVAIIAAGLGALGGYLGGELAESRAAAT